MLETAIYIVNASNDGAAPDKLTLNHRNNTACNKTLGRVASVL